MRGTAGKWSNKTVNHNQSATVLRLSTSAFTDQVLSLKPRVAVFDCDGTLWPGDSGYGFMVWSVETGLLSRDTADWIDSRHRAYRHGEVSEFTMCAEMVQVYKGLHEKEVRQSAQEYFRTHIEPTIFPELRSLLAALQRNGTELWAVSSTNNWVVEEGVSRFGIPASRVLAACVKVNGGVISGELIDVPTDETKATALQRAGQPTPDAVFGNSVHDAAMLRIAQHAFPVNPSPALIDIATQAGWPIYFPDAVLQDKTK